MSKWHFFILFVFLHLATRTNGELWNPFVYCQNIKVPPGFAWKHATQPPWNPQVSCQEYGALMELIAPLHKKGEKDCVYPCDGDTLFFGKELMD